MPKRIFTWTAFHTEKIKELLNKGLTIGEVAEAMELRPKQVEQAMYRYAIKHPHKHIGRKGVLVVKDVKAMPSMDRLIELVDFTTKVVREFDPRQREVFPEYRTDGWAGIVFHGDWHIDHYKTDVKAVINKLEEIGKEEDVFYIFNGDAGDWSDIRFKAYNMPSNVIPIELRYKILHHVVSKIPNLLAVTCGCHDDWVRNRAYFDIIAALQQKRNELGLPTYYLGYGGTMNFTIGKARYRIAVYHKFKHESKLNIYHPCVNYLRDIDPTADVVAISHRHDKMGISHEFQYHKPRVFVRTGGEQYLTDYAWKEGFGGAIDSTPMLLLNGAKKEMKACVDYKTGIEELRRLNSGKS